MRHTKRAQSFCRITVRNQHFITRYRRLTRLTAHTHCQRRVFLEFCFALQPCCTDASCQPAKGRKPPTRVYEQHTQCHQGDFPIATLLVAEQSSCTLRNKKKQSLRAVLEIEQWRQVPWGVQVSPLEFVSTSKRGCRCVLALRVKQKRFEKGFFLDVLDHIRQYMEPTHPTKVQVR